MNIRRYASADKLGKLISQNDIWIKIINPFYGEIGKLIFSRGNLRLETVWREHFHSHTLIRDVTQKRLRMLKTLEDVDTIK